jgi:hypothetical protein
MGGILPLWFDGAVCDFKELPKADDKTAMNEVYNTCKSLTTTGKYPAVKTVKAVPTLLLNKLRSIKHFINFNNL